MGGHHFDISSSYSPEHHQWHIAVKETRCTGCYINEGDLWYETEYMDRCMDVYRSLESSEPREKHFFASGELIRSILEKTGFCRICTAFNMASHTYAISEIVLRPGNFCITITNRLNRSQMGSAADFVTTATRCLGERFISLRAEPEPETDPESDFDEPDLEVVEIPRAPLPAQTQQGLSEIYDLTPRSPKAHKRKPQPRQLPYRSKRATNPKYKDYHYKVDLRKV